MCVLFVYIQTFYFNLCKEKTNKRNIFSHVLYLLFFFSFLFISSRVFILVSYGMALNYVSFIPHVHIELCSLNLSNIDTHLV